MERLVTLLQELENSDTEPVHSYIDENYHSSIPLIKNLLAEVLITKGGNLNWDNKDVLYGMGYDCFAVEQDRFGWLIGAVDTEKGWITFG
jgi:hypothetical protein